MRLSQIALALLLAAAAACVTNGPGADAPALVEIETITPPLESGRARGIHLVTVSEDGSVDRQSHHWSETSTSGGDGQQTLSTEQIHALRALLAKPVSVEQVGAPFDASEFRISAHGSPDWTVECYELEVYGCPIAFVKLWQSLDEIVGELPEH